MIAKIGRPKNLSNALLKKDQILLEASKAFANFGYDKTDVNVVSDAIGIGKGTVYYYFKNKEALFLACVDRLMQQLLESINQVAESKKDHLVTIELAIFTYLDFFDSHPEFVELLIQERAIFKNRDKPTYYKYREKNSDEWKVRYLSLMNENRIRRMPVDTIIDVIGDIVYGMVFINYFSGQNKTMKSQGHEVLDIIFNGILSDSEKNRRQKERSING
jgi:AcrR family transcriptional regulator